MTAPMIARRTREDIAGEIATLRAKQDRMPQHWHDRRLKVSDEIDGLVDEWIAADG